MKHLAFGLVVITALGTGVTCANTVAPLGEAVPLIEAARDGDLEQVSQIVEAKADLSAADPLGRTALHYAAALGFEKIVSTLSVQMAGIDPVDRDGFTPLMRAAQNGHAGIVSHMLERGADPSRTNSDGLTALGLAQQNGHTEVVALFE